MPDRCFVPNCNSGSKSCDHDGKISYFKPPKEGSQLLSEWNRAIPRKDTTLKPSSRVCSRHFEEDDIVKGRTFTGRNGELLFYKWNNWTYKEGAIPRIFPGFSL